MKVGFIGLGKLGFPCALAMVHAGHEVVGYDITPEVMNLNPRPYKEAGPDGTGDLNDYLSGGKHALPSLAQQFRFADSMAGVVAHAEIIFVAIQTPHEPDYEGITRLPETRVDFDYTWLRQAVTDLAAAIDRPIPVVIISTVLPGTLRREISPLLNPNMLLCYNPFFIAMGSTWRDFLNPEFVLFGVHDEAARALAKEFYQTLHKAPFYECRVEEAELIKVAYNTFIGMKIVFANTLMEICHKLPGQINVDRVTDALKLANRRLVSPAYLSAGMGDGGGCHPRDNTHYRG